MNSSRYKGRIKWFNVKEGWGYIAPDAGGDDMFLHISELKKLGMHAINEGQVLEYEVGIAPNKRPCAVNLVVKGDIVRLAINKAY